MSRRRIIIDVAYLLHRYAQHTIHSQRITLYHV